MLKGVNTELVKSHAVSDAKNANYYAIFTSFIIKYYYKNIKLNNILDLGSGIGFVINAIKELYLEADVYGVEISKSAVIYKEENFVNCIIKCQSADNLNNFDNKFFDVIHKRFYPFTRTSNINFHKNIFMNIPKN